MTADRHEQKWILDTFLSSTGMEVLHPTALHTFEQLGYSRVDIENVFKKIRAAKMVPGAWTRVADDIEKRARYWEGRSFETAACTMYERAMLLFGRAYYSAKENAELRGVLQRKMKRCFDKVASLSSHTIEHVEIEFDGAMLAGLFEANRGAENAPCVILLPGMDMFKEDWHKYIKNQILPRGWTAFSLDVPGQGESRGNGLKMGIDNAARAVTAVIDWLEQRPEVSRDKIFLYGASMGCWWGAQAAASEPRLKGLVGAMTILSGNMDVLAYQAQPSFFRNLGYMTGLGVSEDLVDFVSKMPLTEILPQIKIPFLSIAGEFDELTTLDESLKAFDALTCPKEFWIYGDEFHSLGTPSNEWFSAALDWIGSVMSGAVAPGHAEKIFITQTGDFCPGDAIPSWAKEA